MDLLDKTVSPRQNGSGTIFKAIYLSNKHLCNTYIGGKNRLKYAAVSDLPRLNRFA